MRITTTSDETRPTSTEIEMAVNVHKNGSVGPVGLTRSHALFARAIGRDCYPNAIACRLDPEMNSTAQSLSQALGVIQLLVAASVLTVTICVCLWKRNLSPWLYGIAAGCLGRGSGVMFTFLWRWMIFVRDASDMSGWFTRFLPLVNIVLIAADLVIFGSLIAFIFDVAKKTSLKIEYEESIRGS